MKTYNFIAYDIDGNCSQIDVNAKSEIEAWDQLQKLSNNYIYIDLL